MRERKKGRKEKVRERKRKEGRKDRANERKEGRKERWNERMCSYVCARERDTHTHRDREIDRER